MGSIEVLAPETMTVIPFQRGAWRLLPTLMTAAVVSCTTSPPPPRIVTTVAPNQPTFLKDPAEPLNRAVWEVNRVAMLGVVDPLSRGYRAVVPKPIRDRIGNAGTNILYPGRLINELLQGRWHDAGDDSLRFLTNSTLGFAGLFDVASRWRIPEPTADFAQTFQSWGFLPETYVMLPILGPSDQSSMVARGLQEAADPLNYFNRIRAANLTFTSHRLTERNDSTVRMIRQEADPYATSRIAWSYYGKRTSPDWSPKGMVHMPTLETLAAAKPGFSDPDFPSTMREAKAEITATNRRLPFNYRMQKKPGAPLAYVLPGLGSHRLSTITLEIAEHLYTAGFSVVTITNPFHREFMENASTAVLPGRAREDAQDVREVFRAVDSFLTKKFGPLSGKRVLVGASMGGYLGLLLASSASDEPSFVVDRYLAINPPVDLYYGIRIIDEFRNAPNQWPVENRQRFIDNTAHKLAALASRPPENPQVPPFCGIESKFLIGLNFQYTLRDVIYTAEKNHNLGILSRPVSRWNRDSDYQEILRYSYADYARKILIPMAVRQGISMREFTQNGSLENRAEALRKHPDVRIITTRNDFLLRPEDYHWIKSVFGPGKSSILPYGGHLGNIASHDMREAIIRHLGDLTGTASEAP